MGGYDKVKKNTAKRFIGALLSACMIMSAGFTASAEELFEIEEIIIDDSSDNLMPDDSSEDNTENTEDDGLTADITEDDDGAVAGGAGTDNHEVTIPARSIHLKTKQTNELVIGSTFQIKYNMSPVKSDDYVTFKSYNKSIIKVDETGLVTAVGYGKARVQLRTTKGVKKNIYFIVTDAEGNADAEVEMGEITSIEFADKFAMLRVGKEFQLEPIFYPLGLYDNVTYKSSNSSVASVSSTGKVKGISAGSAVITVTASNGVTAEFNVTVYSDVLRGIDVSKWQGDINWKKVSISGVDFAMIRSSYGSEHVDEKLAQNVAGCEKYGIPYGFYHYTYATTTAEAKQEAKFFLKTIKKYSPEYPIVLDIEEEFYKSMSRKQVTNIIVAFMEVVENAGYYTMVYNSPNFIKACIDDTKLQKYDIWIACWGDEDRLNSLYDGHYGMWQYTSSGTVNGINGSVDMDYSYKDYASVIRKKGLNNL